MRIGAAILILTGTAAAALWAQAPEFEVASVKPVPPPTDGHVSTRMSTDDYMLNYSNVTLKDIVAQAYGAAKFRIVGPAWLDEDRYVIHAKLPAGALKGQIPAMLQTLIKERFGMRIHRESKEMPVLALVVAKGGPKLKTAGALSGCHGDSSLKRNSLDCQTDLANLAEQLSTHTDLPVVDKTLLKGPFEIKLEWVPDAIATSGPDAGTTLLEALPEQLGLRLETQKTGVEILVVDSASRIPIGN